MLKYGVDPEGLPKTAAQDGDDVQDEVPDPSGPHASPGPSIAPHSDVGAGRVRHDAPDADDAAHPSRDHDECR